MKQDKQTEKNLNPDKKQEFAGTDAEKVKQEIQRDLNNGQGAMTSREAGAMRD
jgi:uncharacterized protein YueI